MLAANYHCKQSLFATIMSESSLLLSYVGCCSSEGSLFKLFKYHSSDPCAVCRP